MITWENKWNVGQNKKNEGSDSKQYSFYRRLCCAERVLLLAIPFHSLSLSSLSFILIIITFYKFVDPSSFYPLDSPISLPPFFPQLKISPSNWYLLEFLLRRLLHTHTTHTHTQMFVCASFIFPIFLFAKRRKTFFFVRVTVMKVSVSFSIWLKKKTQQKKRSFFFCVGCFNFLFVCSGNYCALSPISLDKFIVFFLFIFPDLKKERKIPIQTHTHTITSHPKWNCTGDREQTR